MSVCTVLFMFIFQCEIYTNSLGVYMLIRYVLVLTGSLDSRITAS